MQPRFLEYRVPEVLGDAQTGAESGALDASSEENGKESGGNVVPLLP